MYGHPDAYAIPPRVLPSTYVTDQDLRSLGLDAVAVRAAEDELAAMGLGLGIKIGKALGRVGKVVLRTLPVAAGAVAPVAAGVIGAKELVPRIARLTRLVPRRAPSVPASSVRGPSVLRPVFEAARRPGAVVTPPSAIVEKVAPKPKEVLKRIVEAAAPIVPQVVAPEPPPAPPPPQPVAPAITPMAITPPVTVTRPAIDPTLLLFGAAALLLTFVAGRRR